MKLLMTTICILGLIILMGVIGEQDYQRDMEIQRVHCENVAMGLHEDYKRICDE